MRIGNREFDVENHCYAMGILNVTPDSFSDGGLWADAEAAARHAGDMIRDGASIIDVGGESTRPGYEPVDAAEEAARVLPVIRMIKERFDIPVSIDTSKAEVALAALSAGADMVNDIWGLKKDPGMAGIIAKYRVPCCIMHNRDRAEYHDFPAELVADLMESVRIARRAGIADGQIILDPGVGFGKTFEQNLAAINHLDLLAETGYPILLGASRKSVVGLALDLPVGERLEGTLATTVFAVMKGASFVRVHDVKENIRAIRMAEAIRGEGTRFARGAAS